MLSVSVVMSGVLVRDICCVALDLGACWTLEAEFPAVLSRCCFVGESGGTGVSPSSSTGLQ